MGINQSRALEIARQKVLADLNLEVTSNEANLGIYLPDDVDSYWTIVVKRSTSANMLTSSEVILVSKSTGEILYHGLAGDEG